MLNPAFFFCFLLVPHFFLKHMFDIILKRKEGTNVDVQKGAQIIDSVIMPGVKIGKNAGIKHAIVGENAEIGNGAVVEDKDGRIGIINDFQNLTGIVRYDENTIALFWFNSTDQDLILNLQQAAFYAIPDLVKQLIMRTEKNRVIPAKNGIFEKNNFLISKTLN
ncbi:glucose-1-phosphate adenylyltransferase [Lactobacillus helveticus]|nr:glucose-1-phosphate adenylyltransferase [Lactobacillus helveticus]MCT3405532.1 glucose-1-phosphate adenylyltransferase [Lactobacillus helveticus]MCT3418597.1 glucose-1-phosphate adenylyltransferase [Lactobacillus helveticus]MCT3420666.1 glucose-1-phosphate adenylyltransferase [Lactobacillus helveticus]